MTHLWRHALQIAANYGVDPLVFGVLYLAHHPLFWGTMAWLAARIRRKRPIGGVVMLAVFFWCMPYLYILVCGHGLPLWIYAVLGVVLLIGGRHAFRQIREKIAAAKAVSNAE